MLGTRAAMFAPVHDLGLAVVWDDGDDLHAEPRAPYPHVRAVLALRSTIEGAALVVGGLSRTAEGAGLVRSGWARAVAAPRDVVRRTAPAVLADTGADHRSDDGVRGARLPTLAWRTAHRALEHGPVLVQVPRGGYLPGLACATCRAPARCPACRGPLGPGRRRRRARLPLVRRPGGRPGPARPATAQRLRSTVVGSRRTAEELGRAFPRTPVRSSGAGGEVLATVGPEPALVVATPGAEPVADGGYAAALLLDGWALLGRPDLRAAEEALRRWTGAAALVRPGPDGGTVVLLGDTAAPAVQALVRWDHAGFADRELAERAALRLPPAARMASLTGRAGRAGRLPRRRRAAGSGRGPRPGAGRAGPRAVPGPRAAGRLAGRPSPRCKAAAGVRSAHKDAGSVRLQVDPLEIA